MQNHWKAGINTYFINKTEDQIRKMMGVLKDPSMHQLPLKD
jgi:hypothetical protein